MNDKDPPPQLPTLTETLPRVPSRFSEQEAMSKIGDVLPSAFCVSPL